MKSLRAKFNCGLLYPETQKLDPEMVISLSLFVFGKSQDVNQTLEANNQGRIHGISRF